MIAAANAIPKLWSRSLTKLLYIGIHAWLLIFPKKLNVDWADNTCVMSRLMHGLLLISICIFQDSDCQEHEGSSQSVDTGHTACCCVFHLLCAAEARRQYQISPGGEPVHILARPALHSRFAPSLMWCCPDKTFTASGLFMEVGFTVAERVLYVPSVGYCLFLVFALDKFLCQQDESAESNAKEGSKSKSDGKQAAKSSSNSDGAANHSGGGSKRKLVLLCAILLIGAYSLRSHAFFSQYCDVSRLMAFRRTIRRNKDWATPYNIYSASVKVSVDQKKSEVLTMLISQCRSHHTTRACSITQRTKQTTWCGVLHDCQKKLLKKSVRNFASSTCDRPSSMTRRQHHPTSVLVASTQRREDMRRPSRCCCC